MKMINKIKLLSLILLIPVLMTACVDKEKNKLDNRVLDFWHAKINKDFKTAYQFLSPGWKKNESMESYVLRKVQSKVSYKNVAINAKKCKTKSLCNIEVSVKYEYQFTGAGKQLMTVESAVSENWIMKDNIWYYLPIKKKLSN